VGLLIFWRLSKSTPEPSVLSRAPGTHIDFLILEVGLIGAGG